MPEQDLPQPDPKRRGAPPKPKLDAVKALDLPDLYVCSFGQHRCLALTERIGRQWVRDQVNTERAQKENIHPRYNPAITAQDVTVECITKSLPIITD